MPRVVTMCDRMCDTKVMFKCATAVTRCVLHAGESIPGISQSVRVRCRSEKSPSFGLCQVDMYAVGNTKLQRYVAFSLKKGTAITCRLIDMFEGRQPNSPAGFRPARGCTLRTRCAPT